MRRHRGPEWKAKDLWISSSDHMPIAAGWAECVQCSTQINIRTLEKFTLTNQEGVLKHSRPTIKAIPCKKDGLPNK